MAQAAKKSLGIIGGGVMGSTIASALVNKKVFTAKEIMVYDRETVKLKAFKSRGIAVAKNLPHLISVSRLVLLAVKPQDFLSLRQELRFLFKKNQTLISVMAGVSLAALKKANVKAVRSMPNLAAKLGEAMTVWTATNAVPASDRKIVKNIFSALGQELYLNQKEAEADKLIDAATALSGSGPAYLFYFAESLIAAGKKIGFNAAEAEKLVRQTLRGASLLLASTDSSAAELRRQVTSKGGTTEAAFDVLLKSAMQKEIIDAVLAAQKRTGELKKRIL